MGCCVLARKAGVSVFHACRVFKQVTAPASTVTTRGFGCGMRWPGCSTATARLPALPPISASRTRAISPTCSGGVFTRHRGGCEGMVSAPLVISPHVHRHG
jgi:hypothetical protein